MTTDKINANRLILLLRTPVLSESCRLTLATLYLYLTQHGGFPSLSQSALLRGVTKQAIQNHLEEAQNKGVLEKIRLSQTVSKYTILWDIVAKTLGFNNEKEVDVEHIITISTPKGVTAEEMSVRVRKPTNSSQMLRYFRAIHRERANTDYAPDEKDKNRLRVIINRYGATMVQSMIDYFAKYRGRLMFGDFTVKTIFDHSEVLYKILERRN